MVKMLERAIAELTTLPDVDQENIGRKLLAHVDKLRALRHAIDKGIASLDRGEGTPLDIDEFLRRMNEGHARS